jgi:hypothetical protein
MKVLETAATGKRGEACGRGLSPYPCPEKLL